MITHREEALNVADKKIRSRPAEPAALASSLFPASSVRNPVTFARFKPNVSATGQ
jgi:hypothetical protein